MRGGVKWGIQKNFGYPILPKRAENSKMYVNFSKKGNYSSIFVWGPRKFLIFGEKERTRSDKRSYD